MPGIATESVLDGIMMLGLVLVGRLPMAAVVETLIISYLGSFVKTSAGTRKTIQVGFASLSVMLFIYTMSLRCFSVIDLAIICMKFLTRFFFIQMA